MTQQILSEAPRWVRPSGVSLLGPVQDSGLTSPCFLIRRPDGQVIQLSQLLNTVVARLDPRQSPDDVAAAVSRAYGRTLTVEGLEFLVESKLRPLGLVEDVGAATTSTQALPTSDPVLSLGLRGTLIPERVVQRLGAVIAPLFTPVVVLLALLALVVMDVRLMLGGQVMTALEQVLATPTLLLGLFALMTVGAVIHELGHAAGCVYSGGRPGRIGFGVYLLFPAFFTNVTDSYRLNRAGRLRTDLGGLYFNVWCLLVAGGIHLSTGNGMLLLLAVLMHIEMAQQLIPTVRFDGYFILTDLTGVPDLFSKVRPVLSSLLPGRPVDARVAELRPGVRRVVTVWVLAVVPLIAFGMVWLVLHLPELVTSAARAIAVQWETLQGAWSQGQPVVVALSTISLVLLGAPLAGLALMAYRMVLVLAGAVWRRLARVVRRLPVNAEGSVPAVPAPAVPAPALHLPDPAPDAGAPLDMETLSGLTAAEFSDEAVAGVRRPLARTGWRRVLRAGTGGLVRLAPGRVEQRQQQLAARVRAPIDGSRRVVVMSRKGGVGKTTVTVALGATFATCRGDRVVAVDANPDAGNLARRIAGDCTSTITDLLGDVDGIDTFSAMRRYTSQCDESRLEVLASDDDARISQALDRPAYRRVVSLLDRYYNLILLDTGTGILDSANQGLLADADQLVLVLRPALDGARAGAQTLDWLEEHGYAALVATAVVVINGVRHDDEGVTFAERHFAQRCGHVTTIPWDANLESGGRTTLSGLAPRTREAFIDVAAALADQFSGSGRA